MSKRRLDLGDGGAGSLDVIQTPPLTPTPTAGAADDIRGANLRARMTHVEESLKSLEIAPPEPEVDDSGISKAAVVQSMQAAAQPPTTTYREREKGAILRSVQMLICPDCKKRGILPTRISGMKTEFSCECGMIVNTNWERLSTTGVDVQRIGPPGV